MSTLWLETVLISDVGDGVGDAIGSDVAVLSADSKSFTFLAKVVQDSFFAGRLAIAGLNTESKF